MSNKNSNNTSRFIINRAGIIVLSHTQVCRYNFFYTIHLFKSNRRKKKQSKTIFFSIFVLIEVWTSTFCCFLCSVLTKFFEGFFNTFFGSNSSPSKIVFCIFFLGNIHNSMPVLYFYDDFFEAVSFVGIRQWYRNSNTVYYDLFSYFRHLEKN